MRAYSICPKESYPAKLASWGNISIAKGRVGDSPNVPLERGNPLVYFFFYPPYVPVERENNFESLLLFHWKHQVGSLKLFKVYSRVPEKRLGGRHLKTLVNETQYYQITD